MDWHQPEGISPLRWGALAELLDWGLQNREVILSSDISYVLSVSDKITRKYMQIVVVEYPDRFEIVPYHHGGRGAPYLAIIAPGQHFSLRVARPLAKKINRCGDCRMGFLVGTEHRCYGSASPNASVEEKRREYARNYMREYYKKHPQKFKDAVAKSNKKNPKEAQKRLAMRLWRKATAEGSYSVQEWLSLVAMYNYTCLACGERKPLTADHIVPLAHGGADTIENIQPLCRSCNSAKGNKTIDYRPSANT